MNDERDPRGLAMVDHLIRLMLEAVDGADEDVRYREDASAWNDALVHRARDRFAQAQCLALDLAREKGRSDAECGIPDAVLTERKRCARLVARMSPGGRLDIYTLQAIARGIMEDPK